MSAPRDRPGRSDDRSDERIDELRAAWSELRPRDVDAEAEGAPADALTRSAVTWTQAAWSRLEPRLGVEELLASRRRTRSVRRANAPSLLRGPLRGARLAAAALVLVGLGLLLARVSGPFGPTTGDAGDELVGGPQVTPPVPDPAPSAGPASAASAPEPGLRLASLSPEHLELRSGPVRLILLRPEDASAEAR